VNFSTGMPRHASMAPRLHFSVQREPAESKNSAPKTFYYKDDFWRRFVNFSTGMPRHASMAPRLHFSVQHEPFESKNSVAPTRRFFEPHAA